MKKNHPQPIRFKSLSEAFSAGGFPSPQHPLIALMNGIDNEIPGRPPQHSQMLSFYKISYRLNVGGTMPYGRTQFDYLEGGLFFAAPRQILGSDEPEEQPVPGCINEQITILIHPDFLLHYPLAQKIKQYNYFSYSVNEALMLSEKEKVTILALFRNIEDELNNRIDEISQEIVISQLELLLNYAQRFYKRQFITRKPVSHSIVEKMGQLLDAYFEEAKSLNLGLPSVGYLSSQLNISAGYLSDMLRSISGLSAQQYIHEVLIEKAKEKLISTEHSVSEIAYELGFEHPQSFSKFFKTKTRQSPMEFRSSFN